MGNESMNGPIMEVTQQVEVDIHQVTPQRSSHQWVMSYSQWW